MKGNKESGPSWYLKGLETGKIVHTPI
jgi:hypothetical protein